MAPPLKIISIVWRIIEPSMIFLSENEQFLHPSPALSSHEVGGIKRRDQRGSNSLKHL